MRVALLWFIYNDYLHFACRLALLSGGLIVFILIRKGLPLFS